MARVIQETDYIKKRKRKYLVYTLICLSIMLIIFVIGLIVTKSRNNFFTVFAALFTIIVAQYGVQYFSIIKFKDGDEMISKALKELPDDFIIWNSALFADRLGMTLVDHMVITDKKIICLYNSHYKNYMNIISTMKRIIDNKGLNDEVEFIEIGKKNLEIYINQWSKNKIHNYSKQNELLESLKSSAV